MPQYDSRIHRASVVTSNAATGKVTVKVPGLIGNSETLDVSFTGREKHAANDKWLVPAAGDSIIVCQEDEDCTDGVFWINTTVPPDPPYTFDDSLNTRFGTGTTTTYLNVITDSTTTRTPALTDASAYILCTHGSGMTVTLPQDTAVEFPTGTQIIFERNGAGTLTFAEGTGATVNSKDGTLTCADRYTTIAAVKIADDTWTIFGNIG
jgi:hypothetical protein